MIGDDIKSQLGATIVHRVLTDLFKKRGVKLDRTYQLNTGGNTDFLNMLERSRLASKKISKTEAVQSVAEHRLDPDQIHVGPERLCRMAERQQGLLPADGRPAVRRRADEHRAAPVGRGFTRTARASRSTSSAAPRWPRTAASPARSTPPPRRSASTRRASCPTTKRSSSWSVSSAGPEQETDHASQIQSPAESRRCCFVRQARRHAGKQAQGRFQEHGEIHVARKSSRKWPRPRARVSPSTRPRRNKLELLGQLRARS